MYFVYISKEQSKLKLRKQFHYIIKKNKILKINLTNVL